MVRIRIEMGLRAVESRMRMVSVREFLIENSV